VNEDDDTTVLRNVGKYPSTRRHVPPGLNLHHHRCAHLQCGIIFEYLFYDELISGTDLVAAL